MFNVFILGAKRTHLCNFKQLQEEIDCRFILICNQAQYKKLSATEKQAFFAVHQADTVGSLACSTDFGELNSLCEKSVMSIIHQYVTRSQADAVCVTFSDVEVLPTEACNNALGIKQNGEMVYFKDKSASKEQLCRFGLRAPRHTPIDLHQYQRNPHEYYDKIVSLLGRTFIVKPTSLASSIGVSKIDCFDDLCVAINSYITGATYAAEEFISGDIYHCDIVIDDDNVLFQAAAKYINTPLEGLKGAFLGSVTLTKHYPHFEKIRQFSLSCIRALGMRSGVAHLELFIDNTGEPVFLECGARAPGALICDTYLKQFGVSLPEMQLRISMGLNIEPYNTVPHTDAAAWAYIPANRAGTFKSINIPQPENGQQFDIKHDLKEGVAIPNLVNFIHPIGHILFTDSNGERLLSHTMPAMKHHQFIEYME